MTPVIFLAVLFILTVAYKLLLKRCSAVLDHKSVPVFIGVWVLIGLALTAPFYAPSAWRSLADQPLTALIAVIKGVVLYVTILMGQRLMRASLSSNLYTAPMSIGAIAIINFLLGERLSGLQWFSAVGVCVLSCVFFLRGHLSDLDRQAKRDYAAIVALLVVMGGMDQYGISHMGWYGYLAISNIVLLAAGLARHGDIRNAVFNRLALPAGILFAVAEIFKFYQSVTINPVTAIILIQNLATPVLLTLSALIWKERSVKEQLIWGGLAFALSLPLFLAK
jgi:hypothetical protein